MLSNDPFYWGSIRKVVAAFGSLFSDIHIVRTSTDGNTTKTIKVPLTYGPKEKWLYRRLQDPMPGVDDQVEMVLPRMSFEVIGYQYDSNRKLTSTGRTVKALVDNNTVLQTQFNPVPYNVSIDLNIMTKTVEDGLMIVEQILPFFVPDYTITITDIPPLGLKKEIVVVLNSVQNEDTWTGNFEERRQITSTLSFTAKAYLYPPVKLNTTILSSQINFDIESSDGVAGSLPSLLSVPYPDDATAETITGATVTEVEKSVILLVSPTTATISSGHSQEFAVTILNTNNLGYTVTGAPLGDMITISGTNFTYTAQTYSSAQTVVLVITSDADSTRTAGVVLTINP